MLLPQLQKLCGGGGGVVFFVLFFKKKKEKIARSVCLLKS